MYIFLFKWSQFMNECFIRVSKAVPSYAGCMTQETNEHFVIFGGKSSNQL